MKLSNVTSLNIFGRSLLHSYLEFIVQWWVRKTLWQNPCYMSVIGSAARPDLCGCHRLASLHLPLLWSFSILISDIFDSNKRSLLCPKFANLYWLVRKISFHPVIFLSSDPYIPLPCQSFIRGRLMLQVQWNLFNLTGCQAVHLVK